MEIRSRVTLPAWIILESVSLCTFVSPPPWVQGRAVQLQGMGWPRLRRPLQLQLPMAPPPPASSTAWPATCILFLSETVSSIARAIYPSYELLLLSVALRPSQSLFESVDHRSRIFRQSNNRISIYYEEKDCRGSCRNRMLNFDNFEDRYSHDVCIYLLLKEEERRNYSNWVLNFDNLANGLLDVRVICWEGEGEI